MRLVTYRSGRGDRAGVLRADRIADAWDALGGGGESVRDLLAGGRLGELDGLDPGEGVALAEVELLPPVPDPDKIVCIGLKQDRLHRPQLSRARR